MPWQSFKIVFSFATVHNFCCVGDFCNGCPDLAVLNVTLEELVAFDHIFSPECRHTHTTDTPTFNTTSATTGNDTSAGKKCFCFLNVSFIFSLVSFISLSLSLLSLLSSLSSLSLPLSPLSSPPLSHTGTTQGDRTLTPLWVVPIVVVLAIVLLLVLILAIFVCYYISSRRCRGDDVSDDSERLVLGKVSP